MRADREFPPPGSRQVAGTRFFPSPESMTIYDQETEFPPRRHGVGPGIREGRRAGRSLRTLALPFCPPAFSWPTFPNIFPATVADGAGTARWDVEEGPPRTFTAVSLSGRQGAPVGPSPPPGHGGGLVGDEVFAGLTRVFGASLPHCHRFRAHSGRGFEKPAGNVETSDCTTEGSDFRLTFGKETIP